MPNPLTLRSDRACLSLPIPSYLGSLSGPFFQEDPERLAQTGIAASLLIRIRDI